MHVLQIWANSEAVEGKPISHDIGPFIKNVIESSIPAELVEFEIVKTTIFKQIKTTRPRYWLFGEMRPVYKHGEVSEEYVRISLMYTKEQRSVEQAHADLEAIGARTGITFCYVGLRSPSAIVKEISTQIRCGIAYQSGYREGYEHTKPPDYTEVNLSLYGQIPSCKARTALNGLADVLCEPRKVGKNTFVTHYPGGGKIIRSEPEIVMRKHWDGFERDTACAFVQSIIDVDRKYKISDFCKTKGDNASFVKDGYPRHSVTFVQYGEASTHDNSRSITTIGFSFIITPEMKVLNV